MNSLDVTPLLSRNVTALRKANFEPFLRQDCGVLCERESSKYNNPLLQSLEFPLVWRIGQRISANLPLVVSPPSMIQASLRNKTLFYSAVIRKNRD